MDEQIIMQERKNTGTAWTRNDSFDKNGFLLIKNLWSVDALYHSVPPLKGQYNFYDKNPEHFTHTPVDAIVTYSIAFVFGLPPANTPLIELDTAANSFLATVKSAKS